MIAVEKIQELVNEFVEEGFFLVELKVSSTNKIIILIDSMDGAHIADCISLSRNIENSLDREEEDFELEVSTPGLGQSFKVPQQYLKNIGRNVEVDLLDNTKIVGLLNGFEDNTIEVIEEKMVKPEGKKRKEKLEVKHSINLNDLRATKIVISFK